MTKKGGLMTYSVALVVLVGCDDLSPSRWQSLQGGVTWHSSAGSRVRGVKKVFRQLCSLIYFVSLNDFWTLPFTWSPSNRVVLRLGSVRQRKTQSY